MLDIAIRVENLSKRYRIGSEEEQYDTFVGAMMHQLRNPVRNLKRLNRLTHFNSNGQSVEKDDVIWALKDVSFEVKRGEVVGVIGRNGAGKSTLLKILSRITHPTSGRIKLCGRVASLLEVGTGFHPELTGRENIYLNGSILGMTRHEIDHKLDEIVDFSGIEKFIDTPVKRYSSGMGVRLAFSVAAHLEPEILLIDEVLAVGDLGFQRKCLGRMEYVANQGRTVLFVSHDLSNVAVLCNRALFLDNGGVVGYGDAKHIIDDYTHLHLAVHNDQWQKEDVDPSKDATITNVALYSITNQLKTNFTISEPIVAWVRFSVAVGYSPQRLNPVIKVSNLLGSVIFTSANYEDSYWGNHEYEAGDYYVSCRIPAHILNDSVYMIDAMLIKNGREIVSNIVGAIQFEIIDDGASRGNYTGEWIGFARPNCHWTGGEYLDGTSN